MTTYDRMKQERVSRRCYTILKYYAEEYGIGTGSSDVFSSVLKSLIDDSMHLQNLLESGKSEDEITELLAHRLLPEVRVAVAEQLAVALENCETAITLFELGSDAALKELHVARLKSQSFASNKQLVTRTKASAQVIEVVYSDHPGTTLNTELCFRNRDKETISEIFTLIQSIGESGFTSSQKEKIYSTVLRYLTAIQPEYWEAKITKRQILNRALFAVDRAIRELFQEVDALRKEKERLASKIEKLDTATLTRAI